jgi:hypothetical protein
VSLQLRDEAWRQIRDGLDVSGSAKVLLLAIAEHCKSELFAREDEIAGWVGLSSRQVGRLRRELIEAGCLVQTAKAAPGRTARFEVLPAEVTPDYACPTNAGQRMADDDGSHPLPESDQCRTSSSQRWTTDGMRTPDNGWPTEPEAEPREPAAGLTHGDYLVLAIEEAERTNARRRANGGEPIEDLKAWATVKARDPTWRERINAERQKKTDQTNQETSIAQCGRCDPLGFVDLDDNTRARCAHR